MFVSLSSSRLLALYAFERSPFQGRTVSKHRSNSAIYSRVARCASDVVVHRPLDGPRGCSLCSPVRGICITGETMYVEGSSSSNANGALGRPCASYAFPQNSAWFVRAAHLSGDRARCVFFFLHVPLAPPPGKARQAIDIHCVPGGPRTPPRRRCVA